MRLSLLILAFALSSTLISCKLAEYIAPSMNIVPNEKTIEISLTEDQYQL